MPVFSLVRLFPYAHTRAFPLEKQIFPTYNSGYAPEEELFAHKTIRGPWMGVLDLPATERVNVVGSRRWINPQIFTERDDTSAGRLEGEADG